MKLHITVFVAMMATFINESQAQFYNVGALVTIQEGALLHIQGDFHNLGGEITHEGIIELGGNWENLVMSGPLTPGMGTVILVGDSQTIGGDFPTLFHDVVLDSSQEVTLSSSVGIGNSVDLRAGTVILNENTLHILNPDPSALLLGNGGVRAETPDSYGYVRWDLGEVTGGEYRIPFLTADEGSIPVDLALGTAGVGADGYVLFSTYPTEDDNTPLPIEVTDLVVQGEEASAALADRFWIVEAVDYTAAPTAQIGLSYDDPVDIDGTNVIDASRLRTVLWQDPDGWTLLDDSTREDNQVTTDVGDAYGTYALWSDMTTSTVELGTIDDVKIFPNPVASTLTLSLESEVTDQVRLAIISSMGQKVQTWIQPLVTGDNDINISVVDLPSGMYTLRMEGSHQFSFGFVKR